MNKPIVIFIICAMIGLGIGYLVFDVISPDNKATVSDNNNQNKQTSEAAKEDTEKPEETTAVSEDNILQTKGCLGCHAVSGLGLQGGATGPDLTEAFNNVEGKHGKPIDEFLKEPTSAVMSSVIGGNPLTDDEISQIVEALKQASESK